MDEPASTSWLKSLHNKNPNINYISFNWENKIDRLMIFGVKETLKLYVK